MLVVTSILSFILCDTALAVVKTRFSSTFIGLDFPWFTRYLPAYIVCSVNFYPGCLPVTMQRVAFDENVLLAQHRVTAAPKHPVLTLFILGMFVLGHIRIPGWKYCRKGVEAIIRPAECIIDLIMANTSVCTHKSTPSNQQK